MDFCSGQDRKTVLYFFLKQLKGTHTKYMKQQFQDTGYQAKRTGILTDKKQTWQAPQMAPAYGLISHKTDF